MEGAQHGKACELGLDAVLGGLFHSRRLTLDNLDNIFQRTWIILSKLLARISKQLSHGDKF